MLNAINKNTIMKQEEQVDYSKYYISKRYIITYTELQFYKELFGLVKKMDLLLLTQVSLSSIIDAKNNDNYYRYNPWFNKIMSKSIDFVIADKTNCRARVCIELDDSSHRNRKRIERDKFVNQLFNDLDIKLLRIKTSANYNLVYIEDEIKNVLLTSKY